MEVPIAIGINTDKKEIRLNNITQGIYFVKINAGEKQYVNKVVVQ